MCDLFQANPWKPLLCTNCHQNRSGHQNLDKCEHSSTDLPSSTSSMHLYEEIMAQYFTTTNINTNERNCPENNNNDVDDDSFSDEEEEQEVLTKTNSTIEFIQNQSMINTQGIVLIGPNLRSKEILTKKSKKINLLKKNKSNADECLKKSDINENNSSKLWWFKVKKTNGLPPIIQTETNKSNISTPIINNQKIRVLPETNKLTLNEALNIARRQHVLPKSTVKTVSNYGSSIASTTSSSTQSSTEYDTNLTIGEREESTYLKAISPIENNFSLLIMSDKINKLTLKHLTSDLRIILNEYKQNLPVVRFQTLKTFLSQYDLRKNFSNDSIYFLLLQIFDEYSHHSISILTFDHFLITYHSTIPIVVPTTTTITNKNEEESIEEFLKNLLKKFFDSSLLSNFNDLSTFENFSYQYLSNQMNLNFNDNNISIQRIQLLELFWNKIPSLKHIQINEDNERMIFTLYYLIRYISQSD